MKQIIVISQGEQYVKYVEIGLLIDQTYAMTLGEEHVHLVKVKPHVQIFILQSNRIVL